MLGFSLFNPAYGPHLTMQIHADKFPRRSFVANATSFSLLQFAGDLWSYLEYHGSRAIMIP